MKAPADSIFPMNSSYAALSPRAWLACTGCLALVLVATVPTGRAILITSWWVGGTGAWDLSTTTKWSRSNAGGSSTGPFDHAFTTGTKASFGLNGSAGTVTLAGDISTNGVDFDSGGYTLALAGHTLASGGLLALAGATVFDFGGTSAAATFGDSSGASWSGGSLTIDNYVTNTSVLRFGTDQTGLSAGQLAAITFTGFGAGALIDSNGYVTPSAIPEPATYAAIFGGLALGAAGGREHRRRRQLAAG